MKSRKHIVNDSFCRFSVLLLLIIVSLSCLSSTQDRDKKNKMARDFKHTEQNADTAVWKIKAKTMVKNQLIDRDITDPRLIRVMENTPRHLFVPMNFREYAYYDGPLSIGEEQTISQPYVVAIMTQSLNLKGDEKVLEIGTGSGYQAAILSQLVDTCYTIELIESLSIRAASVLKELGYNNVVVKTGDGYQGWPEHAPFDCIIITAAPEEIPPKLVEQLKIGGRMIVPVGKFYQELKLVTKTDKGIKTKGIIPVRFVPMVKPKKN